MISHHDAFVATVGLLAVALAPVYAQEPTIGGFDIEVVQSPTPEDPTLLLDVGPWIDSGCDDETYMFVGNFDLHTGETSTTLHWGWWECLLVDPGGIEHCPGPPWSEPQQRGTSVIGFGWFQQFHGGEPIFGESLTTHRIDFEARDMTPRRVTIRILYGDIQYACTGSSDVLRPDELMPAEVSFFIGCRADIDGDGELTLFDFLAFQNAFDAGDPIADFDGDGELTIFDFLAFQNEFDAGCA